LAKGLSRAAAKEAAKEAAESAGENSESCQEEWRRAREICRREMEAGCNRGISGGYQDIENCARGLVSQRCGGNKVEY